jgi:beta-glucanase (GH16 family)
MKWLHHFAAPLTAFSLIAVSLLATTSFKTSVASQPPTPTLDLAALDKPRILKAASAALAIEPPSIAKYSAKLSQGGQNDFYSNGDYWWPDPKKPDGLPYIQKDGQSNPDNFWQHRMAMRDMRDAVAALAAAYRITGEDRYVEKAAQLLRVFFVDPKTRMNPHMKYAQAIPGISPGRGIGIIDSLHLAEVPLAVKTMEKSPALPKKDLADLQQWFREFAEWMTMSKHGKDEAAATNNHSVAFFLQLAVYADFIGDEKKLAECRRQFKEVFVGKQMSIDGSFPSELGRTKPYAYSIFQLDNMACLCQVLSRPDDDLWTFKWQDGRGIQQAMAFLYPYLADKTKWPHKPDVQFWEFWPVRQPCLFFAGQALGEQKYLDLFAKLPADYTDLEVKRNMAVTQPIMWLTGPAPHPRLPPPNPPPAAGEGREGGRGEKTAQPPAKEWKMVWHDEFDKDGPPDPANWVYERGFVRNQELQFYQPENAVCKNGFLVIEARRERKPNPDYRAGGKGWKNREMIDYTSGCLITKGKHEFTYGKFEMRAKIDIRAGSWPAFWTLGSSRVGWPECGEIDIMEYYRGLLLANVCHGFKGKQKWVDTKWPVEKLGGAAWAKEFHVWTMEWDDRSVDLFVDGKLMTHFNVADDDEPGKDNAFRKPHYILLNQAIGGTNGGDPGMTEFPVRLEVDWVRVYQRQN